MYARTSLPCFLFVVGALLAAPGAVAAAQQPGKQLTAADLPELGEALPDEAPTLTRAGQRLSIETPVGRLCADPRAKAVLDSDLPGLTTRPEYVFFKHMSLRSLQAMSRGRMSNEDLAKVDAELAKLDVATAVYDDR